jgi:hypothetical protein
LEADPTDKQVTDKWDDCTKAMNPLSSFLFAADAIKEMEPLFSYLQRQRCNYDGWGRDVSPRLHEIMLGAQKNVLDHILHYNVTMRLTDTALYGNTFTLETMMARLTDSMFKADIKKDVNSYRRNLQDEYVEKLIVMSGLETPSKHDNFAQASADYELGRIATMVKNSKGNQVHKSFLKRRINRAFYNCKR